MGHVQANHEGSGAEGQGGSATAVMSRDEAANERGFSQEQYEVLLKCSEKRNTHLWDKWLREHPNQTIRLKGADFSEAYLAGVHLADADLSEAEFYRANLSRAELSGADLSNGRFYGADLSHAKLSFANLSGANLEATKLKGALLGRCHLTGAELQQADLQEASLYHANLSGAIMSHVNLSGADFEMAIVDGSTLLWRCVVDGRTDFRGVGLDNARVSVDLRQRLAYNVRRRNWQRWYGEHDVLQWLIRPFWWISDYGMSTSRVIGGFMSLAVLFGGVYWLWAAVSPPGIVTNLTDPADGQGELSGWVMPFRVLYFSVVTMTTLGFGEMHAAARSVWGHVLLTVQVLCGYVALGALVTRLSILFTAGGPAGTIGDKKQNAA